MSEGTRNVKRKGPALPVLRKGGAVLKLKRPGATRKKATPTLSTDPVSVDSRMGLSIVPEKEEVGVSGDLAKQSPVLNDYMSESLVKSLSGPAKRPRLAEKAPLHTSMSLMERMVATREDGLKQAISEDNKGFKLLAMMGYKKGQGLGKGNHGRVEPVPMSMQLRREGLGKEAERKEKAEAKRAAREKAEAVAAKKPHEFREKLAAKFVRTATRRQLVKACKQLMNLDTASGVEWSPMWDAGMESEDEEEVGVGFTATKLRPYVRPNLGVATVGSSDPEAEDSTKEVESALSLDQQVELDEWESKSTTEKLQAALAEMRDTYLWCMWCACKYTSPEDMADNCPGTSEDDH